jgi:spermidine synthase
MFSFFKTKSEKSREQLLLATATFVIGVGVMAVEITASRLLAPYFGASMFVWTSLIVTVLVALSFGYFLGGKAAAKNIGLEAVGLLSAGAAVLLVLGMMVLPQFSTGISGLLTHVSSATVVLFLGSLVVTMVVFATPVFLMAVAGPILLKAWSTLGDVGEISGRYFAVSTAGSVIGTVAPTLLLVPYLGSRATMLAVAALFLGLALLLAPKHRKAIAAIAVGLTIVAALAPHAVPRDVIAERESPYQLIRVADRSDGRRFMVFNEGAGIQSEYITGNRRTKFYFDYAALLPLLRPHPSGDHKALIVGLAGGTGAARYRSFLPDGQHADLTGVEVDPAVIDIAQKYFHLADTGVHVVNEDGRVFFRTTPDTYDVILTDAYSTQLYIAPHLATREFFLEAKSRLNDGGVFAMNINAPDDRSPLLRALANTVAGVYRYVQIMPVKGSWNHILLASDEPFDMPALAAKVPDDYADIRASVQSSYAVAYASTEQTFTDDRAPVEFMTDRMILQQVFKTEKAD